VCCPVRGQHVGRRVAASALIAQAASVPYLSGVFGHALPAITVNLYGHLFAIREHADDTRRRMEAASGDLL
jgi:hypothetical protein